MRIIRIPLLFMSGLFVAGVSTIGVEAAEPTILSQSRTYTYSPYSQAPTLQSSSLQSPMPAGAAVQDADPATTNMVVGQPIAQSRYVAASGTSQPAAGVPSRIVLPPPATSFSDTGQPAVTTARPYLLLPPPPQTIVTQRPLVTSSPPNPVAAPAPAPAYRVGRGLLGQPKLYVPSQPIRNALRFLTP